MVMTADYEGLATELLQVNGALLQLPALHLQVRLNQGEPFVLNYLLLHHQAHPVELSRSGAEVIQSFRAQVLRSTAQMLSLLGPEDAKEFIRLRRKLLDNLTQQ